MTTKYPEFYTKNEKGNFTGINGWIDVIDLNYAVPAMRSEMITSMKYWIREFDIDGFRCDMARTVPLGLLVGSKIRMRCNKTFILVCGV